MESNFIGLVGLVFDKREAGHCIISLPIAPQHSNSNGVVHGGAIFTVADTAMGAALFLTLAPDEFCATIEIKINVSPRWRPSPYRINC